mmetsp:Transcript_42469/g.165788  ORF Transcript_42469/g.165788 Transcript_42469/m.165788 type:complete len:205 (+) Transcript_42469:3788-4402(+)
MAADFFLTSVLRSLSPLCKGGTSRAMDAASIECTNSVCNMASIAPAVFPAGSRRALRRNGHRDRTSGLLVTAAILETAASDASTTFGCASVKVPASLGTITGRLFASCRGAQKAIAPKRSALPAFVLQFWLFRPSIKVGSTNRTPCAERDPIRAFAAPQLACRTSAVSLMLESRRGSSDTKYGSKTLSKASASVSMRNSALCFL